ncbi:hypothetical protein APSETT444_000858 [Aspergillus pseudonomiae]
MNRFAFVGLGQMGQAMTKNLLEYGNIAKPLVLYNRTKSTAEAHSACLEGSRVAEDIPDAVLSSDIIWLCLQNEQAVEQAFESILTVPIERKLFVNSSTISPEKTDLIARRVLEAGGEFVAMPGIPLHSANTTLKDYMLTRATACLVMGEPTMAVTRSLTCVASGKAESVDRIRPYVQGVVGKTLVDLSGEEPGQAQMLKLMGNYLIMTTMATVAEANTFAEKCGLGTANMNKLMNAIFPNPPHAIYNRRMLSGEYYSGVPMVEVHKGIELSDHVQEIANACGASVDLYEVARENLKIVQEHEGPGADITGMYGAVRVKSGLSYRNDPQ